MCPITEENVTCTYLAGKKKKNNNLTAGIKC